MAFENISEDEFKEILRTNLTPARAISNPQRLLGREKRLQQIDRAFNSPGKHIFIHGDRGIGKTSLAQTAAILHQSSDNDPIMVACDQQAGFFTLARDILKKCVLPNDIVSNKKSANKIGFKLPGVYGELEESIDRGVIPDLESINDVINILKYVAQFHSREPVIIIDEFDQLKHPREKKYFADLIKQISDQEVGVRLIFCGIGASLDELIGVHLSTDRYLLPIFLERLSHDSLWEIIDNVAKKLQISVGKEEKIRISLISDGFPYYVHLISEIMFWAVYDDPNKIKKISLNHFDCGIKGAISEAQTSLKIVYDKATQKYSDDYQEVLWSVADSSILRRQISTIYEESYLPIMKRRANRPVLEKQKFYARMNNLKSIRHGEIIETTGAGWYQFKENIVRGYVRLCAESEGVPLGIDHHFADKNKSAA